MEYDYHEVDFETWCPKCKHKDEPQFFEDSKPKGIPSVCEDCLENPVALFSRKPVRFEEVENENTQK